MSLRKFVSYVLAHWSAPKEAPVEPAKEAPVEPAKKVRINGIGEDEGRALAIALSEWLDAKKDGKVPDDERDRLAFLANSAFNVLPEDLPE